MPTVAEAMDGFWSVEAKLLGPAHIWLVPPVDEDVRFIVPPTNTGELLPAVAAVGGVQTVDIGFTVTLVVAVAVQLPDDVMVTV